MDWLFDMMDLPDNLEKALRIVRPIKGLNAGVMAVVMFALCWLMWPWLYYFDIESTQVWTQQAYNAVAGTLYNQSMPAYDSYAANLGWFVTGSTYLPTLIELFTVRFATAGIKAARVLVIFFATFDLVTDWPRTSAFIDALGLNGPLGFALKVPLLLLASFGLQSLFIIFLVCGYVSLLNARATGPQAGGAQVRMG